MSNYVIMKNNYVLQFPQIDMSRFPIVNRTDAKETF